MLAMTQCVSVPHSLVFTERFSSISWPHLWKTPLAETFWLLPIQDLALTSCFQKNAGPGDSSVWCTIFFAVLWKSQNNFLVSLSARETHISIFLRLSKLRINFSSFFLYCEEATVVIRLLCLGQHVTAQQSHDPSPGSHLASLENSSQGTFYQVLKTVLEILLMTWISI